MYKNKEVCFLHSKSLFMNTIDIHCLDLDNNFFRLVNNLPEERICLFSIFYWLFVNVFAEKTLFSKW